MREGQLNLTDLGVRFKCLKDDSEISCYSKFYSKHPVESLSSDTVMPHGKTNNEMKEFKKHKTTNDNSLQPPLTFKEILMFIKSAIEEDEYFFLKKIKLKITKLQMTNGED